jgi:uncharacterized damage-inducible protein DinB
VTPPLPEAWLRGPLPGIDPYLVPAAHALVQVGEDLERAASDLDAERLWRRPGGAASVGFHLRHVAGSIDRLLTYARGEGLDEAQRAAMAAEGEAGDPPADAAALLLETQLAIARALEAMRGTPRDALLDPREVGRARLPSTVLGILFHLAEHSQRHTGQVVATARVVRGTVP